MTASSQLSFGGTAVGSNEDGRSGGNGGEVSLMSMGLTGAEGRARDWIAKGLCVDAPEAADDAWYQEEPSKDDMIGRGRELTDSEKLTLKAQAICMQCPVREMCLEYAMTNGETWGVWGGFTRAQRARLGSWPIQHVGKDGRRLDSEDLREQWSDIRETVMARRPNLVVAKRRVRSPRTEGKCMAGKHDWIPENLMPGGGHGKDTCRLCNNERHIESKARKLKTDPVASGKVKKVTVKRTLEEIVGEATDLIGKGMTRAEAAVALGMRDETLARSFQRWDKQLREGVERKGEWYSDGLTATERAVMRKNLKRGRASLEAGRGLTDKQYEALRWAALHGIGAEKEDLKWAN